MTKKRSGSSARGKLAAKNVKPMPDHLIDFSDAPESTTDELKRARRVGRPTTGKAKLMIAIRIDPELLSELRKIAARQSKPYQTLIHEFLTQAAKRASKKAA